MLLGIISQEILIYQINSVAMKIPSKTAPSQRSIFIFLLVNMNMVSQ